MYAKYIVLGFNLVHQRMFVCTITQVHSIHLHMYRKRVRERARRVERREEQGAFVQGKQLNKVKRVWQGRVIDSQTEHIAYDQGFLHSQVIPVNCKLGRVDAASTYSHIVTCLCSFVCSAHLAQSMTRPCQTLFTLFSCLGWV